jgi:hypothetical protein
VNSVFEGIQWDRVEEGWSESVSELPSSSEEEWDEEEESDDVSDQALNQNRYGYQVPAYGRHKSDSEVTYRFSDADTLSLHSLNRGGMSPGDRAEDEFDETLDHYLSDVSGSGSCDALEAGYGSEHGDEAKATPYSSQTSDDSSFRDSDDDRSNETYSCGSDEEASAAYDTYGGLNLLDGSDSSDDMEDADEDTDDESNQDSEEDTESWIMGSDHRGYAMDRAGSSSDATQHAFGASKPQKAETDPLPVLDATLSGHHTGTGSPEIPTMPSYFRMDSIQGISLVEMSRPHLIRHLALPQQRRHEALDPQCAPQRKSTPSLYLSRDLAPLTRSSRQTRGKLAMLARCAVSLFAPTFA